MTTAHPTTGSAQNPRREDDVTDSEQTIESSGRIAPLLREWNDIIREEEGRKQSYYGYDRQAQLHQLCHQAIVLTAAIAGTLAVLMAVLQLAAKVLPNLKKVETFLSANEYSLAIIALIAVICGLVAAFHTHWRLFRFKAEQYRFVKYQYLLHAGHWLQQSSSDRIEHLRTTLAKLHHLGPQDYRHWALGVSSLVLHDPPPSEQPDPALMSDLVPYIRRKRIQDQYAYFKRQAHEREAFEKTTRFISPTCFFLSIFFAFCHFGLETMHGETEQGTSGGEKQAGKNTPLFHKVSSDQPGAKDHEESATGKGVEEPALLDRAIAISLVLSVAAPVVGAGVRTFRGAFEFGRNAIRFEGLATILHEIDAELTKTDSQLVVLELLYRAEAALVAENRAWTRLMLEAEWFG